MAKVFGTGFNVTQCFAREKYQDYLSMLVLKWIHAIESLDLNWHCGQWLYFIGVDTYKLFLDFSTCVLKKDQSLFLFWVHF